MSHLRDLPARAALFAALAPLFAGCGGDPSLDETVEKAVRWHETAHAQAALVTLLRTPWDDFPVTEGAAQHAADGVTQTLGSCVVAEVEGDVVTYTFDGCDGPWGVQGLRGSVRATYTLEEEWQPGDLLRLAVQSDSITIGGATAAMDLNSVNVSTYLWTQNPEEAGFIYLDEPLKHESFNEPNTNLMESMHLDLLDERCPDPRAGLPAMLEMSGYVSVVEDDYSWMISSKDIVRCGQGCPLPGGEITLVENNNADNGPATITFDGSAVAKATQQGASAEVQLDCVP